MKRSLFRNFSFFRDLLIAYPKLEPKPKFQQPTAALGFLIRSRLRLYSSESNSSGETNIECTQKRNDSIDDAGDISIEEIKGLINKFYEGDEEVLPDIFEAVLMKQLNGTPGDELMEELDLKRPADDPEKKEGRGLDESRESDELG